MDASFQAIRNLESCKSGASKTSCIASCYQNIANIYNASESFEKALEYYEKARREWQSVPNEEISAAMNLASKGIVYEKQSKYDEALKVYSEAIKQLQPLHADVPLAYVNSWIGETFLSLSRFDESIESSQKAYAVISQIGDLDLMASTVQNIGAATLKKGIGLNNGMLAKQGFEKLTESLNMHKELNNHEGLISDYEYIAQYHKFTKDYAKALEANEKLAIYKDSVFNFKNKQTLENLENQRTIELRDKELQISKLTIDNKEKQKWYLIGAILLFAVIGLLLFNQSRNRRRTNQKLQTLNAELYEADRVKTRFFSILNHDLRAPVARLIGFLKLQKDNPELLDDESKTRIENQTMTSAENLLESMEDMLLWTKGQMENFSPKPRKVSISQAFSEIRQHFGDVRNVKFEFEDCGLSVTSDPDYLKTILRNLTANAVKALENQTDATITWKAFEQNGKTLLSITDNGPGASQEQFRALYDEKEVVGIKTGLGLHLIRDLAKAIDCTISVASEPSKGTTFTLSFNNDQ
ncbi:tetratricopeptide repeat-containing sensor histidine kinase [Flavobacterium sp. MAH-1]|uniref:histidine kinase n=1 Tax=Flavobacterium agri TaxID=2743471 RepID=A0A7Y9C6R3_9FLAO|nr:tetratricopeptide repeat-containing sensor histidine kinase [Flavobacterium agri]NUY80644.1 tetratricopeptide repeat-containing sensor histidine kinase [Flavobacterium agri]NYA70668.1 tetratricopeptide repeat-containing sensor histidine kinase [Flavobacterium agri]